MFETVEDLTSAVTGVLSPDGPLGSLAHTLTTALDTVWAEFFGSPTPPGGTNWNAYSHEQLYRMLWEEADVGEVGVVAADWEKHSTALIGFADALRREADSLRGNWQGGAAGLAADRLAELSDKIWNAGARAGTVHKAAGDAGDALATARNTMPQPTPDPMTLMTSAVGVGPMNPLAAILVGGARIFTADAVAGVSKAEAVRVMQTYESSLHNSSNQVVPAQSGGTGYRSYQVDGTEGATSAADVGGGATAAGAGAMAGGGGGVPWSRLVGGASPRSGGAAGALPGAGGAVGVGPVGSVLAAERPALSELATRRAAGPAGLMGGPMGARPANDDQERAHRTRLPTVNTGIFAIDEKASDAVIGAPANRE